MQVLSVADQETRARDTYHVGAFGFLQVVQDLNACRNSSVQATSFARKLAMIVQMIIKSATAALKTSDRSTVEGLVTRKQLMKRVVALEIDVGYWKRRGEGGEVVIGASRPPTSSRAWGFYYSSHVDMRQGSEKKNTGVELLSLSGATKLVNDYATTQISRKALSIAVESLLLRLGTLATFLALNFQFLNHPGAFPKHTKGINVLQPLVRLCQSLKRSGHTMFCSW